MPDTDATQPPPPVQPDLVVLVRDLMFSTRIGHAARDAGVAAKFVRDPARLAEVAGKRLVVDLSQPGCLEAAVEWQGRTGGHVVGFVSHVDTATIQAARSAGLDAVLPRSAFVTKLGQIVSPPA
ncbi:MAG: hypothetical protein ACFCVE_05515 [Phycisphaerae bacterium]